MKDVYYLKISGKCLDFPRWSRGYCTNLLFDTSKMTSHLNTTVLPTPAISYIYQIHSDNR